MATKPTLKKIEQIANNEEAAVALFNDNFNTLEEVIQDSVSRSGKVPTNMLDNLDMGDKRIINLGKAVGDNDAVRYKDVKEALKETQNAKVYAQNAENAAIRADASAALADTSKREAQTAAAGAKTSEDNAQMIYDELITNEAVATVHENIADVNTVAADIGNVNTTATNIEDIKAVFDIAKRISYGNIGDISATAANIAPDGCRFLNGDVISRADFPDAFKMLDEGTLPSTPVSAYNAATELVLPYTVISGSPTRSGSVLTVPSSSKITLKTTAAIPGSSATKAFRTKVKVTTAPLPAAGGGFPIVKFAFGSIAISADGSGFKFGFSYFLGSGTSSGSFPSTNVFECNKWYTIESTLNGNSIENKVYDGSSLIETVVSDWNDLENFTRSEFFIENISAPIVYDIDLASTQLVLDDVSYFNGTIVEPQGSVPYFGFDRGSSIAYLPVAQDIFLEAGDVHAALVEAGLPNITGHFYGGLSSYTYYGDGAFYQDSSVKGNTDPYGSGGNRDVDSFGFSAARSNPIYGNSNTVQPAALKYRHYIVLSHREQMIFTMRDPVKAYKDLPKTGNINGDIRMVTDQGIAYIWCRYSRDVWGWSSIGQYLTITAPGKFAWGALGGDLREQPDLYSRLNLPAQAVAGEGIKFEEEIERNYKEHIGNPSYTPTFTYSEDDKFLLGSTNYGSLQPSFEVSFKRDFKLVLRISMESLVENMTTYFANFGTSSSYVRKTSGSGTVVFTTGFGSFNQLIAQKRVYEDVDFLDFVVELTHNEDSSQKAVFSLFKPDGTLIQSRTNDNLTLNLEDLDAAGINVGGSARSSAGFTGKIDLTNSYIEQDGVSRSFVRFLDEPRTVISIDGVDRFVKNTATGSYSLTIAGNASSVDKAVNVGLRSNAYGEGGTAVGFSAAAYEKNATAIGQTAYANGAYSIQIGQGANNDANTMNVGLSNGLNVKLLDSTGKIPAERLPDDIGGGYKSLDETQKTQLLLDGTYKGADVVDGEVFTEYDGKFVEFDKAYNESTDWVSRTQPSFSMNEISSMSSRLFAEGNGRLVLVSGNSSLVSLDGINWTQHVINSSHYNYNFVVFNGSEFVAWNGSYNYVAKSTDGMSWTEYHRVNGQSQISYFEYTGTEYVALSYSGTYGFYTSPDAITWTLKSDIGSLGNTNYRFTMCTKGPDKYVCMNQIGQIIYSTDLVSWTLMDSTIPTLVGGSGNSAYGIVYANGLYNVVFSSSSSSWCWTAWSEDGVTWTKGTRDSAYGNWTNIKYLGNKWYIIALDKKISVSEDGKHFTDYSRELPTDVSYSYLSGLFYGKDKLLMFMTKSSGQAQFSSYKSFAPFYEYSLLPLSYTKEEVDNTLEGAGYLKNTATGSESTTLDGTASTYSLSLNIGQTSNITGNYGVALGYGSSAANNSVALGVSTTATGVNSVAIGRNAKVYGRDAIGIGCNVYSPKSVAIGYSAGTGSSSSDTYEGATAIGYYAKARAAYATQIGYGTNSTANTMNVGLSDSLNVQLLDSNGDIPAERVMNGIITIGSGAPTTATEGFLGKVYIDSTNSQAYICVGDAGTSWTWKQITA